MNKKIQAFGVEKISTLMWKQSIPAMIGMIVITLYNVVDTIFIGQTVGSLGIAALAVSIPVFIFNMAISQSLGMGAGTLVSKYLGEKKSNESNKIIGSLLFLTSIASLLIILTVFIFIEPILLFLGATKEILPLSLEYTKIVLLGTFFMMFSVSNSFIIRAEGSAKYVMFFMISSAILNLILDYVFIILYDLGVTGAAYATLISQIIGFVISLTYFYSSKSIVKIKLINYRFDFDIFKIITAIGISTFARHGNLVLIGIIINNSLVFYGGSQANLALAAYGILGRILMFGFMPMMGFLQGMQPIIAFNYGSKDFVRVKETIIDAIKKVTIYGIFAFAIILLFTENLVSIFTSESDLVNLSTTITKIVMIFFPIIGFQMLSSGIYQSMGEPKKALFISILRQFIIFIPLVLILPTYFGFYGIFYAFPISDALAGIINYIILKKEINLLKLRQ